MGLLDDLKAEAEQARLGEADRKSRKARQEAYYQECLKPAMLGVHRYLQELLDQLRLLDREIQSEFSIPGYQPVVAAQWDRKVTIDSLDQLSHIGLRLTYGIDELKFSTMPLERAREARDFFETQRTPFSDWPIRDHDNSIVGLNFLVSRMRIEGGIDLRVDRSEGCIQVSTFNVQGFGDETDHMQPEGLDDDWLDRLGRYIVCEGEHPNRMQIDENLKADIRGRLESERLAQAEELARMDRQAQLLAAESTGRARLESTLKRIISKVRSRPGGPMEED